MASRSARPIVPPVSDCFTDIPDIKMFTKTYGNNIAASAAFLAFATKGDHLAVLDMERKGSQKDKQTPTYFAHYATLNFLEFSPFWDNLLATASRDNTVKIWQLEKNDSYLNVARNEECTFRHKQSVETVGFHPTADCLLHTTSGGYVNLWDITSQKEVLSNNEHPDVIQSLRWKQDSRILATSCRDKMVRILDPRNSNIIQMSADSHQSNIDSRVVWLGDQDRILTTGFNAAGLGQIIIRDTRNFVLPEKTIDIDCSTIGITFDPEMDYLTGIFMPLFDPDTNMLFLAGKGENTILHMEVTGNDPHLIEGIRHTGEETIGACLVPKRALKVMEGEVNRVLQLTSSKMVIPITYQVPRETYNEFHIDLYPDTTGYKTELTATQWMNGDNLAVAKISLDPAKRKLGDAPIIEMKMDKEPEPKPLLKSDGKILREWRELIQFQKKKRGDAVRFTIEQNKEDWKELHLRSPKRSPVKYKCVICKLPFKTRLSLQVHMKVHEEGIKCNVCQAKFSRYTNLYFHMRKFHKGISFTTRRHEKGMENLKNKCDFCNEGFSTPFNLRIHISRKHKEKQQQQQHQEEETAALDKQRDDSSSSEFLGFSGEEITRFQGFSEDEEVSMENDEIEGQQQHQEESLAESFVCDEQETALEGTSEIEGRAQDVTAERDDSSTGEGFSKIIVSANIHAEERAGDEAALDLAEYFENQKRNLPSTSRSAAIVEPPPPSKEAEADLVEVLVFEESSDEEADDKENQPPSSELDTTAEFLEVDEEIIEIDTDEEVLVEQEYYRCRYLKCSYSSKTLSNRNQHEQQKHQGRKYQCQVCQVLFTRHQNLKRHFLKKHS